MLIATFDVFPDSPLLITLQPQTEPDETDVSQAATLRFGQVIVPVRSPNSTPGQRKFLLTLKLYEIVTIADLIKTVWV